MRTSRNIQEELPLTTEDVERQSNDAKLLAVIISKCLTLTAVSAIKH